MWFPLRTTFGHSPGLSDGMMGNSESVNGDKNNNITSNIESADDRTKAFLTAAEVGGQEQKIQFLLDQGVDVNATDVRTIKIIPVHLLYSVPYTFIFTSILFHTSPPIPRAHVNIPK